MNRIALILALLFAILPWGGCDECEDYQCSDGFAIVIEKQTPWASGTYEIELLLDEAPVHCTLHIPYATGGLDDPCDDEFSSVGGPSGNVISRISNGRHTPERVSVTISLVGVVVHTEVVEPVYSEPEDWKRRCGPPCSYGLAEMEIP